MSDVIEFNFVNDSRPKGYDPVRGPCVKLVRAIRDQIATAEAVLTGGTHMRRISTRHRDLESDQLVKTELERSVRRWWWEAEDGSIHLEVKYGSVPVVLSKKGTAIAVPSLSEIKVVLEQLERAATAGKLDAALAEAARALSQRFDPSKP